jgi:hypothetical protein
MPWNATWRTGSAPAAPGPVHVSMNDYLIHRVGDVRSGGGGQRSGHMASELAWSSFEAPSP